MLSRMRTEGDIAAIRYNLGNRIRLLRNAQDLSQRDFSQMVQINRSYFADVEHGKRNVSIDNLIKISRGFGISLSELCEGVDEGIPNPRALLTKALLEDERETREEDS